MAQAQEETKHVFNSHKILMILLNLTMEFPMEFPIDRGRIAATLAFLRLKDMGTPFPQASRIRMPNIVDQ